MLEIISEEHNYSIPESENIRSTIRTMAPVSLELPDSINMNVLPLIEYEHNYAKLKTKQGIYNFQGNHIDDIIMQENLREYCKFLISMHNFDTVRLKRNNTNISVKEDASDKARSSFVKMIPVKPCWINGVDANHF